MIVNEKLVIRVKFLYSQFGYSYKEISIKTKLPYGTIRRILSSSNIKKGVTNNIIGKQFGRLTVIKLYNNNKINLWLCKCSCGNTHIVTTGNLNSGNVKSCGCLAKEQIKRMHKSITKHGMSKTSDFYTIWEGIKQRCKNSKAISYHNYGGRGITYDPKWETFQGFYDDMYWSYIVIKKSKQFRPSIERIDVNGNYTKSNCTWIPRSDQNKNKRNMRYFKAISPECKTYLHYNQYEFGKIHNLDCRRINDCLLGKRKNIYKGWFFIYLE